MSRSTPVTWDAMLFLRGDRLNLTMTFYGMDGFPRLESELSSVQMDGHLLIMPAPYPSPIYPDMVEVWRITFTDMLYTCTRIL